MRAANEPPANLRDVITTYAQTLSGFGQITADAAPEQADNPAEILFPPALLRRAARYIGGAADLAANGGKLPDGIPETARSQLAATLRRDADGLIAIAATDGSLWPPALFRDPNGHRRGNPAVFSPLSPLAVLLLLKPRHRAAGSVTAMDIAIHELPPARCPAGRSAASRSLLSSTRHRVD